MNASQPLQNLNQVQKIESSDKPLELENQSKSNTNSVPLEDPSSNSGTYIPSFIERAKNVDAQNDESLGHLRKPKSKGASPSKESLKKVESDDEYVDDDFDLEEVEEEEYGSGQPSSAPKPAVNVDQFKSNESSKLGKMPDAFALNLAESESSINFDISGSKSRFGFPSFGANA